MEESGSLRFSGQLIPCEAIFGRLTNRVGVSVMLVATSRRTQLLTILRLDFGIPISVRINRVAPAGLDMHWVKPRIAFGTLG